MPTIATITVTSKSSGCGIEIDRALSSLSGNPSGLRIVHLDPLFNYDGKDAAAPHVGDEVVTINGTDPKNSPYLANKMLSEVSSGDTATLKVIRTNSAYRKMLLSNRFGKDYRINFQSSTVAVLKPKDNNSVLMCTLFPLWKYRFKYEVTFHQITDGVAFKDLYDLSFNRANGATPEQQARIQDHHHEFKEQLEKVEAQMEHDREEARKLALQSAGQ